jgi:hypothetical protein
VSQFFRVTGFKITGDGNCELSLEVFGEGGLASTTAVVDKGLMDARPARLIPALLGTMTEAARIAVEGPRPEPPPPVVPEKGKWIEPGAPNGSVPDSGTT